jgi:hypothetical protein
MRQAIYSMASLGEGVYRFLPKHANVSTISSKTGVTILMMYDVLIE